MRIKSRWRKGSKPKTLEEIAAALAFSTWRIATGGAQNVQSNGWEVHSAAQRFDLLAEFIAFLIQIADRLAYARMQDAQRQRFITTLARHVIDTMEDNQIDLLGAGDYRTPLIAKLNERFQDYAEFEFLQEGPSYAFLRYFGDKVSDVVGERDRPWVHAEIIEIEAPKAVKTLRQAMQDLFTSAPAGTEEARPGP
jgi:hypothetical protein